MCWKVAIVATRKTETRECSWRLLMLWGAEVGKMNLTNKLLGIGENKYSKTNEIPETS